MAQFIYPQLRDMMSVSFTPEVGTSWLELLRPTQSVFSYPKVIRIDTLSEKRIIHES